MTTSPPDEAREAVLAEIRASESQNYRDEVPEGAWQHVNHENRGTSRLLTVRIPRADLDALQRLAADQCVTVSALARRFIQAGLGDQGNLISAIERLERDVAVVKARALAG